MIFIRILLRAVIFVLIGLSSSFANTTYRYTGPYFTSFQCWGTGCTSLYTSKNRITGYIVTYEPIPPNKCCEGFVGKIKEYEFTDGLVTWRNTDADNVIAWGGTATDADGNIIGDYDLHIQKGPGRYSIDQDAKVSGFRVLKFGKILESYSSYNFECKELRSDTQSCNYMKDVNGASRGGQIMKAFGKLSLLKREYPWM
jgi:hypothetical protein